MNIIEGKLSLNGSEKVAIINGRFNHIITDRLVEGAQDAFKRHGGNEEHLDLILVPGAFEVPFALEKALSSVKVYKILCICSGTRKFGCRQLMTTSIEGGERDG